MRLAPPPRLGTPGYDIVVLIINCDHLGANLSKICLPTSRLVISRCSSVESCKHGGVCYKSRCFCTNTEHYGPLCETGKSVLSQYKLLYTISNNIEIYKVPVKRTNKLPHCAVKVQVGEENRFVQKSLYCILKKIRFLGSEIYSAQSEEVLHSISFFNTNA